MPLDDEVIKAIRLATAEGQQPDSVANQLIAWLTEMSVKELSTSEHTQRLALIRDAIEIVGVVE